MASHCCPCTRLQQHDRFRLGVLVGRSCYLLLGTLDLPPPPTITTITHHHHHHPPPPTITHHHPPSSTISHHG
ncbi:hypothetical protein RJ55_02533 [Drechmeria coniospora]|nr:hypothetical protein RJ55_02533 [Drechmeria coniospora]